MQKLVVRIHSDENDIQNIVDKIYSKEVETEVFYNDTPTSLYQMQGGIGAKNVGLICSILFNPLASLFLALSE